MRLIQPQKSAVLTITITLTLNLMMIISTTTSQAAPEGKQDKKTPPKAKTEETPKKGPQESTRSTGKQAPAVPETEEAEFLAGQFHKITLRLEDGKAVAYWESNDPNFHGRLYFYESADKKDSDDIGPYYTV